MVDKIEKNWKSEKGKWGMMPNVGFRWLNGAENEELFQLE